MFYEGMGIVVGKEYTMSTAEEILDDAQWDEAYPEGWDEPPDDPLSCLRIDECEIQTGSGKCEHDELCLDVLARKEELESG